MGLCRITGGLTTAFTALLASPQLTLLASQGFLRGAIEARVSNSVTLTVSQERFQPDINPDRRMLTDAGKMVRSRFCFTDDESVPVSISTQNEMYRLGSSLYRAMQLDLEEMPHLLWDDEVFLVLMQRAVLPVLSQLNGMPAVGLLETGKPDTRNGEGVRRKEPLEGLGETISEHLYRCGRHVLTLPFECRLKFILAWECAVLLILCLDRLKHPIVNSARLSQARHELAGLLLIHEQAVLKCSHEHILPQVIRNIKRFAPTGGGFSSPCLKPGALKPRLVDCTLSVGYIIGERISLL
jgi:hypothetical protein